MRIHHKKCLYPKDCLVNLTLISLILFHLSMRVSRESLPQSSTVSMTTDFKSETKGKLKRKSTFCRLELSSHFWSNNNLFVRKRRPKWSVTLCTQNKKVHKHFRLKSSFHFVWWILKSRQDNHNQSVLLAIDCHFSHFVQSIHFSTFSPNMSSLWQRTLRIIFERICQSRHDWKLNSANTLLLMLLHLWFLCNQTDS